VAICAGDRLASGEFSAWNPGVLPAAPADGRCPIRTHIRRPTRPPLLYFAAVLTVRHVRIRLLTCGAKRARTADLLHAICRQHVHPRPSVQVTVLPRPRKSARVQVSCCTSVLYRRHPRPRAPVVAPDGVLASVNPEGGSELIERAVGLTFLGRCDGRAGVTGGDWALGLMGAHQHNRDVVATTRVHRGCP
jgi:hypothetical protein